MWQAAASYAICPLRAHSRNGLWGGRSVRRVPVPEDAALREVGHHPCATPGPMIRPLLRALGPPRTAKALLMGLRFVLLWSWRQPGPARTEAMYAPMSVTQEPRRELRAQVASAHPELPVDNDNSEHLMKTMNGLDLRQDLHRIDRPTLVVYGSRDAVMVAGGRLPDIGHEPFIEAPKLIFPTIIRFLTA